MPEKPVSPAIILDTETTGVTEPVVAIEVAWQAFMFQSTPSRIRRVKPAGGSRLTDWPLRERRGYRRG